MVKDGELLAGLDELQEKMSAVLSARRDSCPPTPRRADFEDLSRKIDSLRQQILAARNRIACSRRRWCGPRQPVRAS